MIDLKARQTYVYYTIIKRLILAIVGIPAAIYGTVMVFLSIINEARSESGVSVIALPLNIMLIIGIVGQSLALFFLVFDAFYKKRLRKKGIYQYFEIVHTTQIKNNPKVVYVYTCHNDLIEARVLQNIQQTYKNIEVWISDGSDNNQLSNSYEAFAKAHKINYFRTYPEGSANKAANLNTFLEKTGVKYDYLLITDADEALDNRFVEYALKCFNSPHFNFLGYVSPLNYCYDGKTLYTNVLLNTENSRFYKQDYTRSFTLSYSPNLYSSSCLISKELLEANNFRFPDGCLEDIYLENISMVNGFVSTIIPICACGQEYDRDVWYHFKKMGRVYDWQIKLVKSRVFDTYNEKFSGWYARLIVYTVFLIPAIFIGMLIGPLGIWFIVRFSTRLFINPYFLSCFCLGIALGICAMIIVSVDTKGTSNSHSKWTGLFAAMSGLAHLPYLIKHWWSAFVRGKYSTFESSGDKTKKSKGNEKIWFIWCIASFIALVGFVLGYIFIRGFWLGGFKLGLKDWWLILFFYVTIYLIVIFITTLGMCFLIVVSKKINNPDYDENKFVKTPDFYKFKNIEQQYLKDSHKKGVK